ncbi:unnamed protein product [Paramecium sonneborni]|uniref:ADP/ATP translocase n=1 Tax=Paramecium sonneborni TaxID=65129 RepID=A0A8S1PDL7_9CILI|nr:unnamed protein product [Paramecium sonneborni]
MSNTNRSQRNQFLIDFLSGGLSGAIAKTTCAPIERVKLLMQTANMNVKLTKPYTGITDCFLRCVREDGVLSLWRGNGVNVLRYFPTQALNFSFKDFFAKLLKKNNNQQHSSQLFYNILSGGLAGTCSTSIVYPLDLARTRLGVDLGRTKSERQFQGLVDCLTKIYKSDGIRGWYQGIGICFVGIFIYRGLYFGIYDTGRDIFFKDGDAKSLIMKFFYAQCVVIFSETISYPTDTLKRKLMMQTAGVTKKYKNAFDCFNQIMKTEGFMGLMKGNASNMARAIGSSLCLVLYDEMKRITTTNQQRQ